MSGTVEGMRTWSDSKGCRWTCRCRKNKTKMEMKIEFSRIERWEVIGECVSVYHQLCRQKPMSTDSCCQQQLLQYSHERIHQRCMTCKNKWASRDLFLQVELTKSWLTEQRVRDKHSIPSYSQFSSILSIPNLIQLTISYMHHDCIWIKYDD